MAGRGAVRVALCAGAFALAVVAGGAAPGPAAADVAPYGANDAGGFLNVLPPGEAGTDNALQLAQFRLNGQRPAHWDDQLGLYTGLVYASPTLTHDQIPSYFKDATFGVKPDDVGSTESPRAGVFGPPPRTSNSRIRACPRSTIRPGNSQPSFAAGLFA